MRLLAFTVAAGCLAACGDSAETRARKDFDVGVVETATYRLVASDGLLHARAATDDRVQLRASCPELSFALERKTAALAQVTLELWNVMPGTRLVADPGVLTADGSAAAGAPVPGLALSASWTVSFPAGQDRVVVSSVPWQAEDFTFLAFGDIQGGITRFGDVVQKVNEEPQADFILMLGDLTNRAAESEFDQVEAAYAQLQFPVLATPGNHDIFFADAYQRRFGRASYSCTHRGVRFTSVDSSSAYLPPTVWEQYERWLERGADQTHVVFSHIPATEVSGLRSGQWNSRREARHFVSKSRAASVDLLLFGHIHSFDAYALGGIPAFISGGCGAIEEQLDGIDRHFLRVKVRSGIPIVEVVRVE